MAPQLKKTLSTFLLFTSIALTVHAKLDYQLLMISFDGFRWDYLDIANNDGYQTPNFNDMIQRGSKAKWIRSAFTSMTFPNHYTLATGLYEENHGVVNNNMYDPVFDEEFDRKPDQNRDSKWFNNGTSDWPGEPIWLTNQRAHGQLSGVYFWVGSEAAIRKKRPHHFRAYNKTVPFEDRVQTTVEWLSAEKDPVNFAMLYFHEPDATGHLEGPNSVEIKEKIVELDKILGLLIQELKRKDIFDTIDIIVTSDHGMSEMHDTIFLENYADPELYKVYGETPVLHILPNTGNETTVYNALLNMPNVHVYKKDETMPSVYHYKYNRRIQPIVVEAYDGYLLFKDNKSKYFEKGDHGFNNSYQDMYPFFIAAGPSFKKNYISEPFNNVDIYPLLCKLLGVEPAQNDGNLTVISKMLSPGKDSDRSVLIGTLIAISVAAGVVLLIGGIFCAIKYCARRDEAEVDYESIT